MNWRKLRTKRIGSAWWVVGDEEYGRYGPYESKAEADEDRCGIVKSMLSLDDPTYWLGEGNIPDNTLSLAFKGLQLILG